MVDICMYFQVHQPKRLRNYSYFDIGQCHVYEDEQANQEILLKIAHKCYLPANRLLLDLIDKYQGRFKIAFSITGVFLEQCRKFSPVTLRSFQRLAETGCVEFLNETYHHSLSCMFSRQEFIKEVLLHRQLIQEEFNYVASTFRNTELIYNNELATWIAELGYSTILAEGADKILGLRSPNYVYQAKSAPIKVLLRNYRLTDDVGFRFSQRSWSEYPLNASKYAAWLHALSSQAEVVNLFMDFETFGEHQWAETGIFTFLRELPAMIYQHPEYEFVTPTEASRRHRPIAQLDVAAPVSWADMDRDLSAWCGNAMQEDASNAIYALEQEVLQTKDPDLIAVWRSLLTSDHFYYMCTKYAHDGDVHKYFSPYPNPQAAYLNYQNVLCDLSLEIKKHGQPTSWLGKLLKLFTKRRLYERFQKCFFV